MQYEFIPRILSGAAELEIDFYRDLYELGVWWALLSGHPRTPAPHALLAALPQAQAPVQAAVRCGSPRKADRSRRHQGAHSPESRKARRTGGLFRMHQIHSQEVVQMNTQATESKAKEVWEAEQASAHTPLTGQDEDDIEVMKRDFDDVFPF